MDIFVDASLLFLRVMVGLVFVDSGKCDLKDPEARSKSVGVSKDFAVFLGAAELLGGIAVIVGVLQQLAAIGLILIMAGAIQKKMFVWKTGFWGKSGSPGWYYELVFVSMLLVVVATGGGRFVLFH